MSNSAFHFNSSLYFVNAVVISVKLRNMYGVNTNTGDIRLLWIGCQTYHYTLLRKRLKI